jgi:ABC-type multidrug transport system permease subunit
MPLLLIPLLVVGVLVLWVLLLPLSMLQRYRHGRARRRVQPLAVQVNAWLLLVSVPLFALCAWVGGHWAAGALAHAVAGLGAGALAGMAGLRLTRFERTPQGLYFTPPAWLVALLTALVAARLALALWQWLQPVGSLPALLGERASLFAVAGVLLGYYVAYGWGLKRRLG